MHSIFLLKQICTLKSASTKIQKCNVNNSETVKHESYLHYFELYMTLRFRLKRLLGT